VVLGTFLVRMLCAEPNIFLGALQWLPSKFASILILIVLDLIAFY
jgi:hypothetical protein